MRLSSQKDLLLVIIISMAVLTMSWLQIFKGDVLTFIQYFAILLIPGYAIITAIWPTDDRMGWLMRLGVGFVLGLFFILFLPLICNSLKMGSLSGNLSSILLTLGIILSVVAMARRRTPYEEDISRDGTQLTLEESIQRAAEMRERSGEEHEDVYEEEYEYYDEEEYEEIHDESLEEYEEVTDEVEEYYEAPDDSEEHESIPHLVEEHIKTEPSPTEYEQEMDRPIWVEEEVEKKPGFKYWDIIMMLFLSGISLFFLYFNPLKTTTTSMIFFVLLLFILGYAFLTILFPDKSRVRLRILIMTSGILAVALFILAFLAYAMELLPSLPKYMINILFVVSIILVGSAFIRKWRSLRISPEEDIAEVEIPSTVIPAEEKRDAFKTPAEHVKTDDTQTRDEEPTRKILGKSKWEKALSVLLIICLILAISATIYIIVTPKQGEKFTEFYILGPDGKASNYPTNLTTGQNGSVIIGVVNHEYATKEYQVLVKVNGNTTLKNETITLTNGQKMEMPLNFTAGTKGQKKMEFQLYKLPDQDNVYRSLHLWLNIQ